MRLFSIRIIIFFFWTENKIVLLHYYIKKSQKLPKREIQQARKNLQDYIERNSIE